MLYTFILGTLLVHGYNLKELQIFDKEYPNEVGGQYFLETEDGKQATITFGMFGFIWVDAKTKDSCSLIPRMDQSGFDVPDSCVLKPWDDASYYYT